MYKGKGVDDWDSNETIWYQNVCNRTLQTAQHFYDCVEQYTYNPSDILLGASNYIARDTSVKVITTEWEEIMRPFVTGKCFITKTLGRLHFMDTTLLMFNSSFGYRVYLHDQDIFFISFNPSGLPRVDIGIEKKLPKTAIQYIKAKKHVHIDRDTSPCRQRFI